jgi:flagellar biosynthetic protein FliQ
VKQLSVESVISLAERGIYTTLIVSGPLLLLALVVGLIVSIFQATTQIQEQTLAFIPKIVAVLLGIIFFGPWMLTKMLTYTSQIFSDLTRFVG